MQDTVVTTPDVGFLLRICPASTPIETVLRARERLLVARSIFRDPDRWCRPALAVDWLGYEVDPRSPEAVRWDIRGALIAQRTVPGPFGAIPLNGPDDLAMRALKEAVDRDVADKFPLRGRLSLDHWNQTVAKDHTDCVRVLNRAIAFFDDWLRPHSIRSEAE